MSKELLSEIQKAEAEAERLHNEANREARDMIKGVEEAIRGENRRTAAAIREEAQKVLSDAEAKVKKEITTLESRRAEERMQTQTAAEKRTSAAGKFIFERVVLHGNR